MFGGQGQGDLYVVGLGSFFKCSKGILQESAAQSRLPAGLWIPDLSHIARVGARSTRSVRVQVVARLRNVVFQPSCKRS